MKKILMASLFVFIPGLASASVTSITAAENACLNQAKDNIDRNDCLSDASASASQEEASTYKSVLATLTGATVADLTASEKAWSAYVSADCKLQMDEDDGGSGSSIDFQSCLLKDTLDRITALNDIGENNH